MNMNLFNDYDKQNQREFFIDQLVEDDVSHLLYNPSQADKDFIESLLTANARSIYDTMTDQEIEERYAQLFVEDDDEPNPDYFTVGVANSI